MKLADLLDLPSDHLLNDLLTIVIIAAGEEHLGLVVEHLEDEQEMEKDILEAARYEVLLATNGREALNLLQYPLYLV